MRQQHAQFVSSEEFIDAYNRIEEYTPKPPRIPSSLTSSRKQRKSYACQPTLTAEMLLKTQHERETTLGERFHFKELLYHLIRIISRITLLSYGICISISNNLCISLILQYFSAFVEFCWKKGFDFLQ